MNRSVASLLFLAAAVFFAGCSNHPDSFGETGSSSSNGSTGSSGSTGTTDSSGSTGGSTMPAPDTDLAAFARAGIADPEYADAREVNDVSFVSDENPDAFNELF
jgi:hypothetical protein